MDLENVSRLLQPWLWVWEMCASIHRYLLPCGHSQVWNIQNLDILRNCHLLKTYRIACKQNTKVLWSGRSMNKIQGSVYDLKYSWCDDHWLVQSSLLQDPPHPTSRQSSNNIAVKDIARIQYTVHTEWYQKTNTIVKCLRTYPALATIIEQHNLETT